MDAITLVHPPYVLRIANDPTVSEAIFFAPDVLESVDPDLAMLAREREALGPRGWSPQCGYPEVDDVCGRIDARTAVTAARIAADLVPAVLEASPHASLAESGLEFGDYACEDHSCFCTPVVRGIEGVAVDVDLMDTA